MATVVTEAGPASGAGPRPGPAAAPERGPGGAPQLRALAGRERQAPRPGGPQLRTGRIRRWPDRAASPNIEAVNKLLAEVATLQSSAIGRLERAGSAALAVPSRSRMGTFARLKDTAQARTQLTEKIWLFYHNLFEQRTGPFAEQLLAIDRIALDC